MDGRRRAFPPANIFDGAARLPLPFASERAMIHTAFTNKLMLCVVSWSGSRPQRDAGCLGEQGARLEQVTTRVGFLVFMMGARLDKKKQSGSTFRAVVGSHLCNKNIYGLHGPTSTAELLTSLWLSDGQDYQEPRRLSVCVPGWMHRLPSDRQRGGELRSLLGRGGHHLQNHDCTVYHSP